MTVRIPKWLMLLALALLRVAGGGAGGYVLGRASKHRARVAVGRLATTSTQDAQTAWQAREGRDWTLYRARFYTGFYQGCDAAFAISDVQGGILTDTSGRQWTSDDCYKARPNIETTNPPTFPPKSPGDAGLVNGEYSGCIAIVLKANSDLTGTTVPGKPFTASLNYCYHQFQTQYS